MPRNFEKPNEEGPLEEAEIQSQQENIKNLELPTEERADVAIERQNVEISHREEKYDKKVLSGFKKWIGVATVMGASLLAVGCNAEKSPIEKTAPHKTESGFTDNTQDNIQNRLKIKRAENKRMHENSRIVK